MSEISLSEIEMVAVPEASVETLPRSPTWRTEAVGPPWFWPWGLKWPPALVQPLELSPSCTEVSISKPTAKHATYLVDVEATLGVGVEVLDLVKLGCVLVE